MTLAFQRILRVPLTVAVVWAILVNGLLRRVRRSPDA